MNEYWVVTEKTTGRVIAHCGDEMDAIMMVAFDVEKRTWRKQKFIIDQIIDVTSTVDKQLPGQQGLPPVKLKLEDAQQQVQLMQSDSVLIDLS